MNMERQDAARVLVLGLGNVLLGDDGLGPEAIRRLSRRRRWPAGVTLSEVCGGVILYLEPISRSRTVLCLDAIRAGGLPGAVHQFEVDGRALPVGVARDPHGFAFEEVVALSRWLTGLPLRAVVIGAEPLSLETGEGLSAPVHAALDGLVDRAITVIEETLAEKGGA